ncbi:TPA: hypothetical protein ACMDVU_002881 [Vibrio parahaemolyticus]|uniref:hypothetical protein n=1 Tax=Vibrio parahaemolyticus TaxID=670 RepID=UPI0005F0DEFE|nr:hypothetical protein [Vibrio parahaemolyticus]PWF67154.1 hypothetical protein CCD93_15745 [Vibrio sp. T21]EGQ7962348.1 hypothetical protein [Vibrio parahaemolyticus]EGQ9705271.1 hypothetical protein [Vibrio parahaemolyticus]EGQ9827311.1 hypothetical protein [Vibrio parahaemolyticus]EGQ9919640.1 hypothetical protein [Vibrio parahaemolyticus]
MAYVECKHCNYREEANKSFFLKVLGGGFVGGGFWAWVTFFFAGTGFAFAICVAIVTGGVALLAFSDEITQWLSDRYDCPSCNKRNWRLVKE